MKPDPDGFTVLAGGCAQPWRAPGTAAEKAVRCGPLAGPAVRSPQPPERAGGRGWARPKAAQPRSQRQRAGKAKEAGIKGTLK